MSLMAFLLRDADMHSAYLLRRRGWLAGWLSVTRRYCIKTPKPILKFFRPSGNPIILVSLVTLPIFTRATRSIARYMLWAIAYTALCYASRE